MVDYTEQYKSKNNNPTYEKNYPTGSCLSVLWSAPCRVRDACMSHLPVEVHAIEKSGLLLAE